MQNASDSAYARWREVLADTLGLDATDAIAIGMLSAAALIAGAIVIALTVDEPGDGLSHTLDAFSWSRHPELITHGNWLPSFTYLAGLCVMVFHHPAITPRLYNLALGTLTIPAFYAMVRKVYGSSVAIIGTLALTILPLRIALGASGLTEASSLFFMIGGLLCLMVATERAQTRVVPLAMALGLFALAEMTRYEVWPLMALFPCYLYARSRNISLTVLAILVLAVFPIAWSAGNYLHYGKPFYAISVVSHAPEAAKLRATAGSLAWLIELLRTHLGWPVVLGAIAGLIHELYKTLRGKVDALRASYAMITFATWLIIGKGVLTLSVNLVARYLMLGFALALPLAAVAYLEVFGRYRYALSIGAIAIASSIGTANLANHPRIFITREQPEDILAVARWLETSPYRNDQVLMTQMSWQSLYLPLYVPRLIARYHVASIWVEEAGTRNFVARAHPTLLITRPKDQVDRGRIADAIGRPLEPALQKPVYTSGTIEVYDISKLTAELPR